MHQKMVTPALHGNGPTNLAMAIRRPHGPVVKKKFKSFKEAMTYLEEKQEDEDDER